MLLRSIVSVQLVCGVKGVVMRSLEGLLVPGSTEVPECRCGSEMGRVLTKKLADADVRIFRCGVCHHEFQIMVWKEEPEL
jgi:hypothetical protein